MELDLESDAIRHALSWLDVDAMLALAATRTRFASACEREARVRLAHCKLAPTPARLACWRRALTDVRGRRRARNARARWEMSARLAGLDAATDEVERTLAHLLQEDNAQADEFLRVQARTKTSPRGWFRLVQKDRLQRALALACQRGDVAAIEASLADGACVATARELPYERYGGDVWEDTPLGHAVDGGHVAAARILLAHGAPVDALAPHGTTPLMLAAQQGHLELSRLLVARGADVARRSVDRLRRDALGWARGLPGGEESEYDGPPAARATVAAFLRPLRERAAVREIEGWWWGRRGGRPPEA